MPEFYKTLWWTIAGGMVGGGFAMITPEDFTIGIILIALGGSALAFLGIKTWTDFKLKDMKSALKESKVVWGLWHTGGTQVLNILTKGQPTNIKRVLLLEPHKGEYAFDFLTELAGRGDKEGRNAHVRNAKELRKRLEEANPPVIPRFYNEPLGFTFTIFDKSTETDEPNSKDAYVVVQPVQPERKDAPNLKTWVVKNKGKDKDLFEAYLRLFTRYWNPPRTK